MCTGRTTVIWTITFCTTYETTNNIERNVCLVTKTKTIEREKQGHNEYMREGCPKNGKKMVVQILFLTT